MQFLIKLADKNINIHCKYDKVYYKCIDYLSNERDSDFSITITPDDLLNERLAMKRNTENRVSVFSDMIVEETAVYRKICYNLLDYSILLFHGAVVSYEGNAYMFMAKSGVGKTTRAKLWLDEFPGSFIVNGDKPLIEFKESEVIAYGTPWCGKENWNTNISVPLRAIFILERAEDDEDNSISELTLPNAAPFLLQQTLHPDDPEKIRKVLNLIKALDGKVKIYKFRSTRTSAAIRLAYETAKPI